MTYLQAIVLAVVQGLSEFLPVSSSGHLVLVSLLSGWQDQGVAFDAAVHLGTLLAIIVYLRDELTEISLAMLRREASAPARLGYQILIASLPVLLIGFLLADWINLHTRSMTILAAATIFFGLLLGAADWLGARGRRIRNLRLPQVLVIGLAQVLALIPGTSRSGITMTAGLALGLQRSAAARFAFLLSVPVLAAAGGYGVLQAITAADQQQTAVPLLLLAMLIAAVIALLTVKAFMWLLEKLGMWPFVVYRVLLGLWLLSI